MERKSQPSHTSPLLSSQEGEKTPANSTALVKRSAYGNKLSQPLAFLWEFLKNPLKTGAIFPSSDGLAAQMVNGVDLRTADTVVELGSGTGVFTKKIQEQVRPETLFFALEINPDLAETTRQNCPGVIVYNDSATHIRKYLEHHGRSHVDCIISGLPWAFFDEELQGTLMDAIIDVLRDGGTFLTFAYLHGLYLPKGKQFRDLLNDHFRQVETRDTQWLNLPPALIYHCQK